MAWEKYLHCKSIKTTFSKIRMYWDTSTIWCKESIQEESEWGANEKKQKYGDIRSVRTCILMGKCGFSTIRLAIWALKNVYKTWRHRQYKDFSLYSLNFILWIINRRRWNLKLIYVWTEAAAAATTTLSLSLSCVRAGTNLTTWSA